MEAKKNYLFFFFKKIGEALDLSCLNTVIATHLSEKCKFSKEELIFVNFGVRFGLSSSKHKFSQLLFLKSNVDFIELYIWSKLCRNGLLNWFSHCKIS